MTHRRDFLKLTALIAAVSTLDALPAAAETFVPRASAAPNHARDVVPASFVARETVREPGLYRISGLVRLDEPLVEISGISTSQSISWSDTGGAERPVASFLSFERFDEPGMAPNILVRGGRLEALTISPVDLG